VSLDVYEKKFSAMIADGRWADAILYCRDSSERHGWSGWHLERLYEAAKASAARADVLKETAQ